MQKFIRTCQECGHEQESKDPSTYKSEDGQKGYLGNKCKKCKSEALDYGSWRTVEPYTEVEKKQIALDLEELEKDIKDIESDKKKDT